MSNERGLLSLLLAAINKTDPDIIIGHDFSGASLHVLLHRTRDLKVDPWSRLASRSQRLKWLNIGKQVTNLKFMNGRLLCDLASDGTKVGFHAFEVMMTESLTDFVAHDFFDELVFDREQRCVELTSVLREKTSSLKTPPTTSIGAYLAQRMCSNSFITAN